MWNHKFLEQITYLSSGCFFFILFTACIYRGSRARVASGASWTHPLPQSQATPSCTCRIGNTLRCLCIFVFDLAKYTGQDHRGLIGEPLENLQYGLIWHFDLVSRSSFSSIAALMSLFSSSNIILMSTWCTRFAHFGKKSSQRLTSRPSSPGSTPRWKRVGGASNGACAWAGK